jgi:hypothetical protein
VPVARREPAAGEELGDEQVRVRAANVDAVERVEGEGAR